MHAEEPLNGSRNRRGGAARRRFRLPRPGHVAGSGLAGGAGLPPSMAPPNQRAARHARRGGAAHAPAPAPRKTRGCPAGNAGATGPRGGFVRFFSKQLLAFLALAILMIVVDFFAYAFFAVWGVGQQLQRGLARIARARGG